MTLTRATAAFVVYTLLAILLTYPLVWHVSTQVPHDLGDPLLSIIYLWWNAHHVPLSESWWTLPFFWPAPGTLAYSDHRLGVSLIATPLQWMGFGPLAAYNITLLATFPLCALAMYWFAHTLTRRHDAAFIAGLAYGFSPYRFAHLEHLELLAAFGLPVALAALHRYLDERHWRWLVLFAVALYLQALASSYFFLFFLPLLALWIVWFVRRGQFDVIVGVAIAGVAVGIGLAPIAWGYTRIHALNGFARDLNGIVMLSADVTSIVTAPPSSVLWGWTGSLNGGERQIFPGLTLMVLIAAGVVGALRARARGRLGERGDNRVAFALIGIGLVFVAIAASAQWLVPGLLSIRRPFKPFSIGFYAIVAGVLWTSWVREAFRRRSLLAFYVLAAVAMFILSLGPKPAFMHEQILYESPYAWLMRLTLFRDGVRVPARFAMLMVLALSAAGAIAYARLTARRVPSPSSSSSHVGLVMAGFVSVAILADSWIRPVPMFDPPSAWPRDVQTAGIGAFARLPLGDTMVDFAAMYDAMLNGLPTVNGASGYAARQFRVLSAAFDEMDDSVFDALAETKPFLVVIDRGQLRWADRAVWLDATPGATRIAENDGFLWYRIERRARVEEEACGAGTIPIAALRDTTGAVDPRILSDGENDTYWANGESQRAGDALTVDLGQAAARPCSVQVTLGSRRGLYPRRLSVATSEDGVTWRDGVTRRFAGEAVRAVLERPRNAMLTIPVPDGPARYIRLRLEADQRKVPWIVTEIAVTASQ